MPIGKGANQLDGLTDEGLLQVLAQAGLCNRQAACDVAQQANNLRVGQGLWLQGVQGVVGRDHRAGLTDGGSLNLVRSPFQGAPQDFSSRRATGLGTAYALTKCRRRDVG